MNVIQPIVEGHGEEEAFPELLRRILWLYEVYDIKIHSPHRRSHSRIIKEHTLKIAVKTAKKTENCKAVFILFDADDDCPKEIAGDMIAWSRMAAAPLPCYIVIANREYEAWFLAGIESLRGKRGISNDAAYQGEPEAPRDAKGRLEGFMPDSRRYKETLDQTPLTAELALGAVFERSRSFRKLIKEVKMLLVDLGYSLPEVDPFG